MQISYLTKVSLTRVSIVGCFLLLQLGCGSNSQINQDSAPKHVKIDFASIPDAVPRHEPYAKYGNPETYEVFGKPYQTLKSNKNFTQRGIASWYGTKFHGRRTSSGETYNMYAMTAAHKTLPLPTYVRVKNLDNGRQITVKVNDRGPFHEGRIIDLSYVAANKLGIANAGTGRVEIETISFEQENDFAQANNAEPISNARMFVQVGAYSNQNNAENVQLKLAQVDIESNIKPVMINTQQRIYRVRIGPFNQKNAAQLVVENLHSMGLGEARIFLSNEY